MLSVPFAQPTFAAAIFLQFNEFAPDRVAAAPLPNHFLDRKALSTRDDVPAPNGAIPGFGRKPELLSTLTIGMSAFVVLAHCGPIVPKHRQRGSGRLDRSAARRLVPCIDVKAEAARTLFHGTTALAIRFDDRPIDTTPCHRTYVRLWLETILSTAVEKRREKAPSRNSTPFSTPLPEDGFEPPNDRVRADCLTAWRLGNARLP